jgi:flavin reductase (DIM6/NTAB) family NADH-FMN oxidoreductase RutF
MTASTPSKDSWELKKAFGNFLTGVTVVTTQDANGVCRGFTANSFTSVSLDPPLLLVCLDRSAVCFEAFAGATRFAVNILSDAQRSISNVFASKSEDKFSGLAWQAVHDSPVLNGCMSWFACDVHDRMDAGDHMILIGRVLDFGHRQATPLGYHNGNYVNFELERHAVEALYSAPVSVGAILEKDGKVLLIKGRQRVRLPRGRSLGEKRAEPGSVFAELRRVGVRASVSFVYSLFHDEHDRLHLYYRGTIEDGPDPANPDAMLVAFQDVEWDSLSDHAATLIRRYASERAVNRFGVFVGSAASGMLSDVGSEIHAHGDERLGRRHCA